MSSGTDDYKIFQYIAENKKEKLAKLLKDKPELLYLENTIKTNYK